MPERILGALALMLLLSACGVDGQPLPPEPEERPTSGAIILRGEAEAGVVG